MKVKMPLLNITRNAVADIIRKVLESRYTFNMEKEIFMEDRK